MNPTINNNVNTKGAPTITIATKNTILSKEPFIINQLLLLLSELLALLARTVRVRALSAVLTDVASTLGVLAGLLRILAVTGHDGNKEIMRKERVLRGEDEWPKRSEE